MKNIFLLFLLIWMPASAQSSLAEADRLFAQRNFDKARPLYETHLRAHPNNTESLERLGEIAAHQKDWNQSLAYFTTLRGLNPKVADHHYKYGAALAMVAKESNTFKALGMIGDIRAAFEQAISLDPKHIGARWALIELNLQLPAIAGGSEKKALRYANELAVISPVDGWLAKGRIAEDGKRYKEAEKYYRNAVRVGGSRTTYQKLANLYKKMDQPEKARLTMETYNEKQN